MIEQLIRNIEATAVFQTAMAARDREITLSGLAGSFASLVLAAAARQRQAQMVIVCGDSDAAERMQDDLGFILGADRVRLFSAPHALTAHHAFTHDVSDIQALRALKDSPQTVLVTSPRAMILPLPPPAVLDTHTVHLATGDTSDFPLLVRRLEDLGFERKDFVETHGDIAVRGGILDIFTFAGDNPVRVEFTGDEIESIREFDPLSQRSIRTLARATIIPDLLQRAAQEPTPGASLLDYVHPDATVVIEEPGRLSSALEQERSSGSESLMDTEELMSLVALFGRINVEALPSRGESVFDFDARSQPSFNGSIAMLRRDIAELQRNGYTIYCACDTTAELTRLKDLLRTSPPVADEAAENLPTMNVEELHFSVGSLHSGFTVPSLRLAFYTEHQMFNRLKRRGRKRTPKFKGFTDRELQQLRRGDFVVHQDFGIGCYDGMKRIRIGGAEQEVVKILYDGHDTLFVNLNYITKLQKYSSKEGHIPSLSRLGSGDWERLKSRAKKKAKDIARELISLYALRKQAPGIAFSPDTPWQKEMEASFMYEDTFDQAKATLDVKRDMEAPHPMDRLICGDVGFGKTEIAVRAAFKAVLEGKQVAVLVPTTILAMQHFNTFRDRLSRYGVRLELMSRFRLRKEQTEVVAHLRNGGVDIVIGTHRILSKDIAFKDLGLLIIDEEHRFGVSAKEKLRHLRANVDTLSLTATPIPRTLHFSLMGARDLSIIATPPRNRLPVSTEILQWNDEIIRDAIVRELQRGGQVYFVHDRVQTIDEVSARLQRLLPSVRFRSAHGQLVAHELEEVMMVFLEKQCDVLVSTKIIESGLDIPNVNTIIVNRADRFGMAELYQLRGRVGRSNVQAYAYLLTPPIAVLPKPTLRRLQAVEEFTELGSGFNLAMRDLEIRGAGNLLGAEQSGFIETMGFETYTRILEEAVQELKVEEFAHLFDREHLQRKAERETMVETDIDAFIPESYIAGDADRLAIYRKLYGLSTPEQLEEIRQEMRDRFGKFPSEIEHLFGMVRLRLAAASAGFRKVRLSGSTMEIEFPPDTDTAFYESPSFQVILSSVSRMRDRGAMLKETGGVLRLHVGLGKEVEEEEKIGISLKILEFLTTDSDGKRVQT